MLVGEQGLACRYDFRQAFDSSHLNSPRYVQAIKQLLLAFCFNFVYVMRLDLSDNKKKTL